MATPRKAPAKRAPARKAPAKPRTLAEVVKDGDRRSSLTALRDHLAALLVSADRDHAAIARQLTVVLREIDELPNPAEESRVDDIAARRAARLAKAASQ